MVTTMSRTLMLATLATLATAAPGRAQNLPPCPWTSTARAGGLYSVYQADTLVSQHQRLDKAVESAARAKHHDPGSDVRIQQSLDIRIEFVNIGGGIGIPYRPEQEAVDVNVVSDGIRRAYDELIRPAGLHPLKLFMEMGRMITGPYGYLVTRVRHLKDTYKKYVGLDASMANLMRPAMYGAYHHITVMGKKDRSPEITYDVTGSLCENNDKFAINRQLPAVEVGDVLVIHDAGAHGHAMGFNYNGKLRSAELLLKPDGTVRQIRRAETMDDHFATLDFSSL